MLVIICKLNRFNIGKSKQTSPSERIRLGDDAIYAEESIEVDDNFSMELDDYQRIKQFLIKNGIEGELINI
jgi:hypothetical protein